MRSADIELGHGVTAVFNAWGQHERAGMIEYHPCAGGNCRSDDGTPGRCGGGILFDLPGIREAFPNRDLWQVQSMDPLTLTPSVACGCRGCTHHGYVRDGKWVPA